MRTNRRQFLGATAAAPAFAAAAPKVSEFESIRKEFPRAVQQVYLDAAANMPLPKYTAEGMRRAGSGVLQVNSDFGPGEFEALDAAAMLAGRPLSVLLVQVDAQPKLWRETLAATVRAEHTGCATASRRFRRSA